MKLWVDLHLSYRPIFERKCDFRYLLNVPRDPTRYDSAALLKCVNEIENSIFANPQRIMVVE